MTDTVDNTYNTTAVENLSAEDKEKRAAAITKGYTVATTRLREKHMQEFNQLRITATRELGWDWTPEPTPAEKALAEAKALIAQHPEILNELLPAAEVEPIDPESKTSTEESVSD